MISQTATDQLNEEKTYKEQLDKAAQNTRDAENEQPPNPVIEKSKETSSKTLTTEYRLLADTLLTVTEYIPAAAKILPTGNKSPPKEEVKPSGPPERPAHDDKIEEFVRDQHRSKADDLLGETPNDE